MKTKQFSWDKLCLVMLVVGLLLRMHYAAVVPYDVSPHDIGILSDGENIQYGHLGYIQYLYQNRSFPDTMEWQFYQPPLFHSIGAMVMSVAIRFMDVEHVMELIQYINMLFSCVTILFGYLILKKLRIDGVPLFVGTSYLALCPVFYAVGTEMNNDSLMTMFMTIAVYETICWTKDYRTSAIVKTAICIALSMLAKTSGVLLAPAVAAVFLYCFVKEKEKRKQLFYQFVLFGAICIPVGLSWVIRQRILFGVPFSYVLRMSEESNQYLGMCTLTERIGLPNMNQILCASIDFGQSRNFANIWGNTILTSNFDEGLLHLSNMRQVYLCWMLTGLKYIIVIWTLGLLIKSALNARQNVIYRLLIPIGFVVVFGSYIRFAFLYPFVCTMNVRYIVICAIFLMAGMGVEHTEMDKAKFARTVPLYAIILLYCAISTVLYWLCAV